MDAGWEDREGGLEHMGHGLHLAWSGSGNLLIVGHIGGWVWVDAFGIAAHGSCAKGNTAPFASSLKKQCGL